ncbi:MAG: HAD-IA family hydrolase [Candidatus Omnitrophota bacterium]
MDNVKLIIFDLDGTLVNAYRAITKSVNYAMKELGYPLRGDLAIRRAVGWGDRRLLEKFVNREDLDKAVLFYRRHQKIALLKYSSLMPEARLTLESLKAKGCKLAVASNRPTQFSEILIRHLKLARYFDYCLCADKLKLGKPHPEILRKIMRRLQIKRSQSVYVGDMLIDAQAGRRAGIKTIIVTTGSSKASEIKAANPQSIIRSLSFLKKALTKL